MFYRKLVKGGANHLKLVSNFNRHSSEHGGSCIYVRKY